MMHTAVKVAERATWVHVNHCRRVPPIAEGGAIAGGGSARVSINAKIQFEKPLHCSCVFRRNQISAQPESGWTS